MSIAPPPNGSHSPPKRPKPVRYREGWMNLIPEELRQRAQWVGWQYRLRHGKYTKVPFRPRNPNVEASSTDPATWGTFDAALAAFNDKSNKLDGIGFVFSAEDPYVGIDFDNCYNDDGTLKEWVRPYLARLRGYGEVSPSGRGLKLFCRGTVPGGKGRKRSKLGEDGTGAIEIYDRGRYFTTTGNRPEKGPAVILDCREPLAEIWAELFPPAPATEGREVPPPQPVDLDDQAILDRAFASKNGHLIADLFRGDIQGYGSQSEADLALCTRLMFWFGGDTDRIDRVFRSSGLYRPKWDEMRGAETYGQMTLATAAAGWDGECYKPKNARRRQQSTGGGKATAAEAPQPDGPTIGWPKIVLGVDEYRVNSEAIEAISAMSSVYQRGNALVTVHRQAVRQRGMKRPAGAPRIVELKNPTIRENLSICANFVKIVQSEQGEQEKPAAVPQWTVNAVATRGEYPGVRTLAGVVEAPTLRLDGTTLDEPGWDAATGLLYEPNAEFPPIPANPTRDDARAATAMLLELVAEFPFGAISIKEGDGDGGDAYRHAWLAALLTLVARHAIDGPVPLFLFDANCPGSGKSKLCDVIGIVATGRDMARADHPDDETEMAKTLLSIALAADPAVLFDNLTTGTAIGGKSLDRTLTSRTTKGRILGRSEMTPDLEVNTVFYASGNNLGLRGDALRRVVPIRLVSQDAHPEERQGFKIPNLLAHVCERRGELVVAALTILRAYVVAGRPACGLTPMDFPEWCGLIRNAIHWATGVDPCKGRETLKASDPASGEREALVRGWLELEAIHQGPVTAAAALHSLLEHPEKFHTLREVVMSFSTTGKPPSAVSIGKRLQSVRDRTVAIKFDDSSDAKLYAIKGTTYQGTVRWSAVEIKP